MTAEQELGQGKGSRETLGPRGVGPARRHHPPPRFAPPGAATLPSLPICFPSLPSLRSGSLPYSPLPPPPRSVCLCSGNSATVTCCWGWGLSEVRCLPLRPVPGPNPANLNCVLSPNYRADCYKLVRLPTALPIVRPTSAQRPTLPPNQPPSHSSDRQTRPLETRTNLEDAFSWLYHLGH
uniref:Uncharacterized protein n=1 Tax=Sus scrofa TaxID=9823 RepID=A0A4X1SS74_PIG